MLIVCPSCASQYTIEAGRIGPTGRVVRCAACREPWFIAADAVDPRDTYLPATLPSAASTPTRAQPVRRAPVARPAGARVSVLLAACLIGAMGTAVAFRTALVRRVPESAIVFATMGLSVNLVGLTLDDFRSSVAPGLRGLVLTVSGVVGNPTDRTIRIPRLALTIEGEHGESLYDWTDSPAETELRPHATTRFEAQLASPPPAGHRLVVTFSTGKAGPEVASR